MPVAGWGALKVRGYNDLKGPLLLVDDFPLPRDLFCYLPMVWPKVILHENLVYLQGRRPAQCLFISANHSYALRNILYLIANHYADACDVVASGIFTYKKRITTLTHELRKHKPKTEEKLWSLIPPH